MTGARTPSRTSDNSQRTLIQFAAHPRRATRNGPVCFAEIGTFEITIGLPSGCAVAAPVARAINERPDLPYRSHRGDHVHPFLSRPSLSVRDSAGCFHDHLRITRRRPHVRWEE